MELEPSLVGAEAPEVGKRRNPFSLGAVALLLIGAALFLWKAPDSYTVYKAIHVGFAVVWVGGGAGLTVIALMAERASDPRELATIAKYAEQLAMKVFTPSGLLVVIFGVLMVHKGHWGWGTFWIDFALVMWAVSFLTGVGYLGPTTKKLHAEFEASGGEMTAKAERLIRQILSVARVDVALLLLVVLDMAAKPTF
jgi:uncharacterized membrane protein